VAIEVPIHSAGIVGKPGQRAGNVDYESWATVLNINTMGPLRVTETFIDHLARGERKLAVTITSGMGSVTPNKRNPAERHLSFAGNCSDNRSQLLAY
jgi:short-subunit dehydrogenase involved in D-alanine esterification of teichoic acids